jgi:hypothetical protein
MATKIYETADVELLDGRVLYVTPLKLKYYRQFMDIILDATKTGQRLDIDNGLVEAALVCMKQYCPEINTKEQIEDLLDIKTIYKIIKFGGNVTIGDDEQEQEQSDPGSEDRNSSWQNIDLAKIESEVFLLGIYKDYEDLEASLSLQELISIINMRRDLDYEEKKFLASIQGIDIEGKGSKKEVDPWEAMKARVFSKGQTADPNDITSFQGPKAAKVGFGVGMGIDYVDMR